MIKHPGINPVIVHIWGPFAIRWYGLAYALGFLLGLLYLWYMAKKGVIRLGKTVEETLDKLAEGVIYVAIGVIIGGRLGYVLFYNLPYYLQHPLEIIAVWHGGMSFHGGFIGSMLMLLLFSYRYKYNLLELADLAVTVAPIGLFFGRIANFINAELYGKPTNLPWGVIFPGETFARHPTQIYEALLEGLVIFIVMLILLKKRLPVGFRSYLFLLLYGIFRFLVEFVRLPDPQLGYLLFGWVTMGQILSFPMIIWGAWGVFMCWGWKAEKTIWRE